MSQYFARVFLKILDSSIAENYRARHLFEDFFKLADWKTGIVDATRETISRRLNIPIDELNELIEVLESPDPKSRNANGDGRRLARLDPNRDWGWKIVNWEDYNKTATRVYKTNLMAAHRERKAATPPQDIETANDVDGVNSVPWASVKAWLDDARANGADYTEDETREAFLFFRGNGWKIGKNPVIDYRAAIERQITSDRSRKTRPALVNPRQNQVSIVGDHASPNGSL